MKRAPKVNIISAIIIVFFRPNLSEIGPPKREDIAAPYKAKETINSF